jgi:hypothetical protein
MSLWSKIVDIAKWKIVDKTPATDAVDVRKMYTDNEVVLAQLYDMNKKLTGSNNYDDAFKRNIDMLRKEGSGL